MSAGLKVIYHAIYQDADPSAQTITLLSDGGNKFRVTFAPPGYADFLVSDGVREVDSIQGELEYATSPKDTFIVGTRGLTKACPGAKRTGPAQVAGRTGVRYVCKPGSVDEFSEMTIDSGTGILLAAKAETSTIAATSIDVNATIPAGSFDLPKVTSPAAPAEGMLNSQSPGVPDAQAAAAAIERCRADSRGALPPAIGATRDRT
jgi:hypothetical protein